MSNFPYQPEARGHPASASTPALDPERDFTACRTLYLDVQTKARRAQDAYMLLLLRHYFASVVDDETQFTHCLTTEDGRRLIGALVGDLRGTEHYYARREAARILDAAHSHGFMYSSSLTRPVPPFSAYNKLYAAAHAFLTRLDAHDDIEMLNHLYQTYVTMYTGLPAYEQTDIYHTLRNWLTVRVENAVMEAHEQRAVVNVTHALVLSATEIAGTLLPAVVRDTARTATEWLDSWQRQNDPTEIRVQTMCLRWRNQLLLGLINTPWIDAASSHLPNGEHGHHGGGQGHGHEHGGAGQYGAYVQHGGHEQYFWGGHGGQRHATGY